MKFDFWNQSDPVTFIAHDWDNPIRAWAGAVVRAEVQVGRCREMAEVGPGPGVDYARQFRPLVQAGVLRYTAFEGSGTFCASLARGYPESVWRNEGLDALPPAGFDLVYEKAVLEHQPALEPSIGHVLRAARNAAVLVWFRVPADAQMLREKYGVFDHIYSRTDVLVSINAAGFVVEREEFAGENLGQLLRRVRG